MTNIEMLANLEQLLGFFLIKSIPNHLEGHRVAAMCLIWGLIGIHWLKQHAFYSCQSKVGGRAFF